MAVLPVFPSCRFFRHRLRFAIALLALSGAASPALAQPPAAADSAPLLVHEGKRVRIPAQSPLRTRIQTGAVHTVNAPHTVTVPGVIEADPARSVNVLSPLAGRLVELRVHLGEAVTAGMVLGRVQSPDLLQAGSDLVKARDASDLALRARDRARQVNAAGGNAVKDLEAAESAVVQAQVELDRARTRIKALGADENLPVAQLSLPLVAPISGVVAAVNIGQGSQLNDLTAPVLALTNVEQMLVTAQVPEQYLAQVRVGQSITAVTAAWPERPLHGTVTSVGAALDPVTRRTPVRARFANPGAWLRANMFATVQLNVAQAAQVMVPASALVMSNDRVLVFVEVQPWVFEPREVELGLEEGDQVRVRRGLAAAERVVVRGGVLLND